MTDHILVAVAWPYANGRLHLGRVAGALLPADIFARYQRLRGNRVLMVSGSDGHGTPITIAADQQGISPRTLFEQYHQDFLESQLAL
ncbi:MAG: class I tRNA ligase family protein, partial [Anaerolineae bacterium]|nr:class I tRNA ligase family protein [Anaerolineae bacterium]